MHIFVTGGTGFFGKAILRYLQKTSLGFLGAETSLTFLSRNPQSFIKNYGFLLEGLPVTFHQGDILDPASLPQGLHPTHILHAATDSTIGPRLSPLERYDQIVQGTRNVLDFAIQRGVKRFLLTSSGGVYGPQPYDMLCLKEDYCGMPDPLDPSAAYSVGKRAAEHLCALYQERFGLESVIARCFAFVGPDLPFDVHFAIGNFIKDALQASEIIVGGDGTPLRSYLYQDDLALWLLTMLLKGKKGCAYNLGSDEKISIVDLAHLIRDILAPYKPVTIKGSSDLQNKKNLYIPNIDRAKHELGLQVFTPLKEAIQRTVDLIRPYRAPSSS